jgi:hypothetical protein
MDCCDDILWRSLRHMCMGRSEELAIGWYKCTNHILWCKNVCNSEDVSDMQQFVQLMAGTTPLGTTSLR